jgi:NADPH-dependent 2,4-dienoyl-CoA reductase/sulfur reductase-like enzyme
MAAALKAYEEGIKDILILERAETLGGILEQCIHTGFGLHYFGEELSGPEYADRFIEEIYKTDIDIRVDTMVLNVSADNVVTACNNFDGLLQIKAKAVVLAMGCRERPRGALSIAGCRASGIMTAGTAQKYVNLDGYMPGHEVVILGSGDIGLIMARRMTLEGAKVKAVCELMPYSGGLTRNIVQCLEDFGIPLRLSCTVVKTHGKDRLEGVTVANVDKNLKPILGTEEYIPCDTLMLSVGLIPENELSKNSGIDLDPVTNGPVVDEYRETVRKGVFACGNVLQVHDLVDYVTEESQIAGEGAAKFIKGEKEYGGYISTKGENGVRYIVPQRINKATDKDVKLYFRVGKVFRNVKLVVKCGDEIISSKKKNKMTPGEMEYVPIKLETIKALPENGVITVTIEEA